MVVRSHDPNGKALLAQAISHTDWTSLYRLQTCDEMVNDFYGTVSGLIDYYLPLLTVTRHTTDKPWVTDHFRRLIRCRQYALKHGQAARYRSYRNRVQQMSKVLQRKYYAKKIEGLRTSNSRNWWRRVKFITGQKTSEAHPLSGLANQLHDGDTLALAANVNAFFQSVAADLSPLDNKDVPLPSDVVPSEFYIDRLDVERKLSQINIYKAPGPDGLPNWVLRDFCTHLAGPVCAIFNASVREGFVPARWKEANVIPVPKVNPPRSIESDLRPISLTATLGKLLESFVGSWILERVSNELDDRQYGALKSRSTTHALVDMLHQWHSAVDRGQSVRTVFVDFAKAFDHVDHNVLVAKLTALGLPDIILRWMYSFLSHRRQRVKISDIVSEWLEMSAGMPQGSYLGPLTFVILIDSLRLECTTHKYVDDTTVTEILNKADISCMQTYFDELVQQSTEANMNVNVRKTKEMLIGTAILKDPPLPVTLSGVPIERVVTFKVLGVHVASDLKWTPHIEAMSAKVASRLYFLKQLRRAGAGLDDLLMFYCTVIRPVLEYACPVWHSSLTVAQSKTLEYLQKRAMNIISGGDYATSLAITGVDTLEARREQLTRRFFRRSVVPEESCLHYLLPDKTNCDIKLRHPKTFPLLMTKTERFRKTFMPYCLRHHQ